MNNPQRLHPITILFVIIANLKEMVVPFLIYAGINLFSGRGGQALLWTSTFLGILILFIIVQGVLRWYRQLYSVADNEFHLERGAWMKKKIYIPLERIQSVDDVETIWHRLFGVVQIRIETASGQEEPEAILEALSRPAAGRLKDALMGRVQAPPSESTDTPPPAVESDPALEPAPLETQRLGHGRLLLAGLTSGRLGMVLALIGPVLSFADDLFRIDAGMLKTAYLWTLGALSVGWIIFMVLLIAWLISILSTVIQDYHFTVSRDRTHLMIQRGLLERRRTLIPLRRIQAVHLVESLGRQPFGYVTIRIESAGYGAAEDQTLVCFPLLKRSEVPLFLDRFLPEFAVADKTPRQTLPRRVWRRMALLALPLPLLLAVGLSWLFPGWGYVAWVLLPLTLLYQLWRFRDGGWMMTDALVGFRGRRLSRTTTFIPGRAMQSRTKRYTLLTRYSRLAVFSTNLTSGNRYDSPLLEDKDVTRIIRQFDPEPNSTSV